MNLIRRYDDINCNSKVIDYEISIMQRNLFPANIGYSVLTENISADNLITIFLKREAEAGSTIFLHGNTHRDLTELSVDEIYTELRTAKKKLESVLFTKIRYYAPPKHKMSTNLEKALEALNLIWITDNINGKKFEVVHLDNIK